MHAIPDAPPEEIRIGQLTLFEMTVPPGAKVPGIHFQDALVETIYGLDGILFSPDGSRVYVTSASTGKVVEFRRSAADGFMVYDHAETVSGQADVSASVAIDGQFLFASAAGGSLRTFAPDTVTGAIPAVQQFTDEDAEVLELLAGLASAAVRPLSGVGVGHWRRRKGDRDRAEVP